VNGCNHVSPIKRAWKKKQERKNRQVHVSEGTVSNKDIQYYIYIYKISGNNRGK
jgi:hypothetical protein